MKTLVDLPERSAAQHSDRPAFVTHKFPSWLRWQVVLSLRRLLMSGFGNRLRGFGASLLGNGFPFVKEGSGVRESLEYVREMLEQGWNVLIFPEGKLTVIGPTEPFKSGIGLLAFETGASVLPTRIDVLRAGFYEGKWLTSGDDRVAKILARGVGEIVEMLAGRRGCGQEIGRAHV